MNACEWIKMQIEQYEERMISAMAEGDQEAVRRVCDDFQNDLGRELNELTRAAPDDLRIALLSILEQ